MSALYGGTSLTVAMAFLCIILGVLVCFYYFALKAKKSRIQRWNGKVLSEFFTSVCGYFFYACAIYCMIVRPFA